MDAKTFGQFIQSQRKDLGLTQAELAEKLHVTDKAVSRWERGVGFPEVTLLEPLAKALGLSLLELMQSRKQEADTLSTGEAEAAVAGALELAQDKRMNLYLKLQWFGAYLAVCAVMTFFLFTLIFYVEDLTVRSIGVYLTVCCSSLTMDAVRTSLKRKVNPENPALRRDWKFYLAYALDFFGVLLLILSFPIRNRYGKAACDVSRMAGFCLVGLSSLYLLGRDR